MKRLGVYMKKKSLGGGGLKLWAFHPSPPCTFKWNSPEGSVLYTTAANELNSLKYITLSYQYVHEWSIFQPPT